MDEETRERLERIEAGLAALRAAIEAPKQVRRAYSVAEAARLVGRNPCQVRIWCQEGRIRAEKRAGRSKAGEWLIPAEEIDSYRDYGLRPPSRSTA